MAEDAEKDFLDVECVVHALVAMMLVVAKSFFDRQCTCLGGVS